MIIKVCHSPSGDIDLIDKAETSEEEIAQKKEIAKGYIGQKQKKLISPKKHKYYLAYKEILVKQDNKRKEQIQKDKEEKLIKVKKKRAHDDKSITTPHRTTITSPRPPLI